MANSILETDIRFLAGVGEKRAQALERELGVRTFADLLYHFPFRYVDRSKIFRIAEINEDTASYIQLRVRVTGLSHQGAGHKKRLCVSVADASGSAELVWFKGIKWIEKRLEAGREYIVFGRATIFNGQVSLVHPELESLLAANNRPQGGMQGIYSSTERLSSLHLGTKGIFSLICSLWQAVGKRLEESLPEWFMKEYNLMPLQEALYNIHFPECLEKLRSAERRLKFEELFGIQLSILARRSERVTRLNGLPFGSIGERFNSFYANNLPFELTGAQKRVIKEIRRDMASGIQMNRLLQGDVGSGKTLVALMAMLIAADNGYQSALMAPTEILARQHFASIERFIERAGVNMAVLTGATGKRERDRILSSLKSGKTDILIGTHALIEERVEFSNLGFVVIDEQHRFGVEQRARLWTKNRQPPHILVMTATPIPRTLAMTLYGDLDLSVIDELPAGRKTIKTAHYHESHRLRLFGFIRRQIDLGRQVYIVYPLIKESEKFDLQSLYEGFRNIIAEFPLPQYNVIPLHGRMKAAEKQACMLGFKAGEAHIMVATSVIEVGVDVPNATVMVIENAERFGLSQLHQLRGRVGRGAEQSYCILMTGDKLSREARERISAMVSTNDGFALAELDMKLRGSGDLAGTQQSGDVFELKIASLGRDGKLVEEAREAALKLLDNSHVPDSEPMFRRLTERYAPRRELDFSMIS